MAKLFKGRRRPRTDGELLQLCHDGQLVGGLSVALDLKPDELIGPLTAAMGGSLRVHDVRGKEITVHTGEATEKWEVEGLDALVHNLNDLWRAKPDVRLAAVLGEWEDMLQLWCVPREELEKLLEERWFQPRNRADLERYIRPDDSDV